MLLNIITYPNKILRQKSKPVEKINQEWRDFILDMIETMKKKDGVGLAAPQVGVSRQIVVVHYEGNDWILVNPQIIRRSFRKEAAVEGCLSLPGVEKEVKRPKTVVVKFLDYEGRPQKIKAKGMLARIFQHEIDHLNGILIIDK